MFECVQISDKMENMKSCLFFKLLIVQKTLKSEVKMKASVVTLNFILNKCWTNHSEVNNHLLRGK